MTLTTNQLTADTATAEAPVSADHNWFVAMTGDMFCSRCQRTMVGLRAVLPCDVRDGWWTVECTDGCLGTGRIQGQDHPDYYARCRGCDGTGRVQTVPFAPGTPD